MKICESGGKAGGKFLLKNYLKRRLSTSEQDKRVEVWGGERRDCLY